MGRRDHRRRLRNRLGQRGQVGRRGLLVVIADRNVDGARERAAELGAPHTWAQVEVTDEDSVARLFDDVVAREGGVHVVVNCAGFSGFGLITDLAAEDFRSVIDVCLTGAFLVMKHAGRHLGEGGTVVSLTSLNARQPAIGMSSYCAAKGRPVDAHRGRRAGDGSARYPGQCRRPRLRAHPLTEGAAAVPGVVDEYVENTVLGRAGTPEDIADAVAFLCSEKSSWLTGEVLDLNGGAHLKRYPNIHAHLTKLMGQ